MRDFYLFIPQTHPATCVRERDVSDVAALNLFTYVFSYLQIKTIKTYIRK